MFRDLKEFTSHTSNFKSLRNVQDGLVASFGIEQLQTPAGLSGNGVTMGSTTTSTNGGTGLETGSGNSRGLSGCIPFLGESF